MNKINLTRKETDFLLNKLQDILSNYVHGGESSEIESAIEDIINVVKEPDLKTNLKPFDLNLAKAGKPVCLRDGSKVRIICFERKSSRPIVALVTNVDNENESVMCYNVDGYYHCKEMPTSCDLMMLPEKKEGWVNIYALNTCYSSKEEAEANIDKDYEHEYVRTVKIKWEE